MTMHCKGYTRNINDWNEAMQYKKKKSNNRCQQLLYTIFSTRRVPISYTPCMHESLSTGRAESRVSEIQSLSAISMDTALMRNELLTAKVQIGPITARDDA